MATFPKGWRLYHSRDPQLERLRRLRRQFLACLLRQQVSSAKVDQIINPSCGLSAAA